MHKTPPFACPKTQSTPLKIEPGPGIDNSEGSAGGQQCVSSMGALSFSLMCGPPATPSRMALYSKFHIPQRNFFLGPTMSYRQM